MKKKHLTITKPDDWHVHLRDDLLMQGVIGDTAMNYGRALVMPNLNPPILNVADAMSYKDRLSMAIKSLVKSKQVEKNNKLNIGFLEKFRPLMAIYLSENISIEELEKISNSPDIIALKYYPAGATTNSQFGVKDIKNCYKIFEGMSRLGVVLCVHGEVADSNVDIFDRESKFIDDQLIPLRKEFPELKIVFEHVSTKRAVEYILETKKNLH